MQTAKDLMTTDILTIGMDCPVQRAIDILLEKEISGLPVTGRDGRLLGILTEFALLAIAYDPQVGSCAVAEYMSGEVISVDPETTIERIADLLILHRIRRVPVVADGKLVGLISRRDVLRAASKSAQPISQSVLSGIGQSQRMQAGVESR